MELEKIYVTTIERSYKFRKENLMRIKEFGRSKFNIDVRFGGIDGSKISQSELDFYIKNNIIKPNVSQFKTIDELIYLPQFLKARFMKGSEIGCFLSHFNFWLEMVNNNLKCALFLEDDAFFDYELLADQIKTILSDYDSMKFFHVSLFKHHEHIEMKKQYLPYNEKYHRIDARSWGTVGYLLTLDGAKHMLQTAAPIKSPLDYTLNGQMEKIQKGYLVKNCLITLCDKLSFIRDETGNPTETKNQSICNIGITPIKNLEHIFTVGFKKPLNLNNYKIENHFKNFENFSEEDIEKFILEGKIMPHFQANINEKNKLVYSKKEGRFLSTHEISQFLTHVEIWKKMIEEKIPYAIVLDNNVQIDDELFNKHIKIISENAPSGFYAINLKMDVSKLTSSIEEMNSHFFYSNSSISGNYGYVISLIGAINYWKHITSIENPIDYSMRCLEELYKSGYLYKQNFICFEPKILTIDRSIKDPPIEVNTYFYIGTPETFHTFNENINIKPTFFKSDNLSVSELLSFENGIIDNSSIKDGKIIIKDGNQMREMTSNELNEYLAHVSFWTIMEKNDIDYAIIQNNSVQFIANHEDLKKIYENLPKRCEIISFIEPKKEHIIKCNHNYYYFNSEIDSLPAYLISKKGASDLLKIHKPIRCTISKLFYTYGTINKVGYIPRKSFFSLNN